MKQTQDQSSNILAYSIAGELLNYVSRVEETDWISLSRLESEVFGGIESTESLAFWTDVHNQLKHTHNIYNYSALIYALFIAMTDEEIHEIRNSYFKNEVDRININRSAV